MSLLKPRRSRRRSAKSFSATKENPRSVHRAYASFSPQTLTRAGLQISLTVTKSGMSDDLLKLVATRLNVDSDRLTLTVAGKPVRPRVDLAHYELRKGCTLFASSGGLPGGAPQKEKRPIAPAPWRPRKRSRPAEEDSDTDDNLDGPDYDLLDDTSSDDYRGWGEPDEEDSETEFEAVRFGGYTFCGRRSASKYLDYQSRVNSAARKTEMALHRERPLLPFFRRSRSARARADQLPLV